MGSLHEADIFKICIKTLQASQLAQILPLNEATLAASNGATTIEATRMAVYKLFTKVWSAYCKTLVKEVLEKGKVVICPVFGAFSQLKNLNTSDTTGNYASASSAGDANMQVLCYMPSQLLLSSPAFRYRAQHPVNLDYSTLENAQSRALFKPKTLDRMPYTTIGKMTGVAEQTVAYILKLVMQSVENTMESGYTSKLDLKVGQLRFSEEGQFQFVNNGPSLKSKLNEDSVSQATSCNTTYRIDKRHLTTLRERPGDYDQETVFSTVKDALSQSVFSSVTPTGRQRFGYMSPAPGARANFDKRVDADSIFSAQSLHPASFHAANPNPQATAKERFLNSMRQATNGMMPGLIPNYLKEKPSRRMVFNTDVEAHKEAIYA